MSHKEGQKKVTLETIMANIESIKKELHSNKNEILERIDLLDREHEKHFAAIQEDLLGLRSDVTELKTDVAQLKTDVSNLKTDVSELKTDMTAVKKELKEFRSETNSFQSGFAMKIGRQDAFNFRLTGLLAGKNILSQEQSISLRTI